MKKILLSTFLLFIIFSLTACSKKEVYNMDQPASDGKYYYTNEELSFSVTFPQEFIYYQTQRKDSSTYKEVQFFLPTNDLNYSQEVPGYARVFFVRAYDESEWDKIEDKSALKVFSEKKNKVYVYSFWEKIPSDWGDRWNEEIENSIEKSLKINK